MAMFRTGVKILRELSPRKGHCILPIRSISEERHLVSRNPCPTNSIPQNTIERSISWMSTKKEINESTLNSGLPLNAQSSISPISGKPSVGSQHRCYKPVRKRNPQARIIKDGYISCCEEPYPSTFQGPPFTPDQNRRVRRNSKRPPFKLKPLTNTAHYKPPYTEYKMAVDTRQPKMQGHFLKMYDVNEITVRSDSVAAHPNYVDHHKIGQTPSGKCLRSSKPISEEVTDTRKMEILMEQSLYPIVNQQGSSFSKIPTLMEAHATHRNISTSQSGKLNPEVQEVKKQDIKTYAENPVCNLQEFSHVKQINKNNFGYTGRIPAPSYSEMKKAELQTDGNSKTIFPMHKFDPIANDALLIQKKPFAMSGKSLKYLCSEASVRPKFNANEMKSHEVSDASQIPLPNISIPAVQSFAYNTKPFSDSISPMSKLHTTSMEQKAQPQSKFKDSSYSYDQHSKPEMQANISKLKDSNNANNNLKSEELPTNEKTRNLKKVQVNRGGRESMLAQKDYSKHDANEQKEYSTVKERHEPVYQQKVNFKEWQENGTQRGNSNNYDKVEQANVESYSKGKAFTESIVNTNKENMSKSKDIETDVIAKKSFHNKQKVSSLLASEEKPMQTVTKSSKDSLLRKHIPTTNISHFLNIESVYDRHKKFQNPFSESVVEHPATDGLLGSKLTEVESVVPREILTNSSDKNTECLKQNKMNSEPSDKSFNQFSSVKSVDENKFDGRNQSQGSGKSKISKQNPSKSNGKFSSTLRPRNVTQFGSRNYSIMVNTSGINSFNKIGGSITQSCNMGTKHPKLGDLSSKDLPNKVPCGTKKIDQDCANACKRVCVPGCIIPRQVECESDPATPPPCVKVEAPQPSFSECLKCPPLPPYSKITECHVEKPKGYYREYKGMTADACNPPVPIGTCPVRNAFKRVKRVKGEYNVNCEKPPKYPCEVESTFPPSRLKPRDGVTPMKCQSNNSSSGSSLSKFSPTQVRFYSSGKLNSPLIKKTKNETDVKADSQPTSSCVYQTRCIHTPVSFISCTTSQFNAANLIKPTGSAQNLSCDCGDSMRYGHDIPLRYKYGDFFPTSTYRKTFMPNPGKTKRASEKPSCSTSTAKKTCVMTKSTGPGFCGNKKTIPHIPYYPSSPYRPTHPCKPSNSDCNPSCIKPPKNTTSSECGKQVKSNDNCSPPCIRPNCPTPAIKRPCSCGPQDVHSKPLQMRCFSGTSFSRTNSKDSLLLKRHFSDVVPSLNRIEMKGIPPFLSESNALKFPNLERLKQSLRENEPSKPSDNLNKVEAFPNIFNGKQIKFPAFIENDMKCEDEGCGTCKKPKCDRCEKKQCPRPQYKQCPKPPPRRRMCEEVPKCPPKPGLKSNRDCNKPCCPDRMCKPTENSQAMMASGEKAVPNSGKELSKTSTLQGLYNSLKSFVSFFIAKSTTKDSSTATLEKSEDVKVESETLQAQEGRTDIKSGLSGTGLYNNLYFKSEKNKNILPENFLSKTFERQYCYPFDKRTTR